MEQRLITFLKAWKADVTRKMFVMISAMTIANIIVDSAALLGLAKLLGH